jgi:uncharacterized membrane protein
MFTVLNVLAAAVAAYLTYIHYKPALTDFCNFGEKWNCDIVNKSIYAEIFGIPVALLGLLAYLGFLAFSIRGLFKDQTKLVPLYFFALSGSLAFALYLTGIETFVLKTYCLFCVIQQVLILIQWGVALRLYLLTRRHA